MRTIQYWDEIVGEMKLREATPDEEREFDHAGAVVDSTAPDARDLLKALIDKLPADQITELLTAAQTKE